MNQSPDEKFFGQGRLTQTDLQPGEPPEPTLVQSELIAADRSSELPPELAEALPLPINRKLHHRSLRCLVHFKNHWLKLWARNGGEWSWLQGKPMPLVGLNRKLWRIAEPSINYLVMLLLSGIISTLGLLAGSTATIIGAMIVAPLMGPIIAVAFAIVMGNRRLLKRSTLSLVLGIGLTIFSAWAIAAVVGLDTLNPEITARIRPTLIDLGVALAAGAAGTYANTHRGIADALPGVAIAVALVPPLSVIGIGLAMGSETVAMGSALLFLTNLTGIIFSGALVLIGQEYGKLQRAKSGLVMAFTILALLGLPLSLSMRELVVEGKARQSIYTLISRRTVTFSRTDIQRIRVKAEANRLLVHLEVAAPSHDSISQQQVILVRDFLERELQRPIDLNVQVFPVRTFSAHSPQGSDRPYSFLRP